MHYLSNLATDKYEAVRGKVQRFLNAGSEDEILFSSGTTEAINLIAYSLAMPRMQAGDEIVLSVWSGNAKGHRFYQRNGFRWVGDTYFMVGNHRDDEYLYMRPMR